jgi:hypothetical protein
MAGRVDALDVGRSLPAILYIQGSPFDAGVVRVAKVDVSVITVHFQNQSIDFARLAASTNLRDLDLPVEIATPFVPQLTFEVLRPVGILASEILLAINGKNYFHFFQEPEIWAEKVNADYPGLVTLISTASNIIVLTINAIEGIETLALDLNPAYDPDPTLNFRGATLDLIDENYGQEHERMLQAYRDFDTEADSCSFRLPTMATPSLYDNVNPPFKGVANEVNADTGEYRMGEGDREGWPSTLLPQPRVIPLLERALATLGYRLTGQATVDDELRNLLLVNSHDLNIYLRDLGPSYAGQIGSIFFEDLDWVVPRPRWNLADYCPDLTVLETLELFAETFAHIISVRPAEVELVAIRDLLAGAPEDWTDKLEAEHTVDYGERHRAQLNYNRQGDKAIFPGQLEGTSRGRDGDPPRDYTVPVFSLFEREQDVSGRRLRLPLLDEVGRNQTFDTGGEVRLRFLFPRGRQPAAGGQGTYPQASHSRQGYGGEPVGRYSLEWEGEGGLLDAWWGGLLRLLRHDRTDRRRVHLSLADLLEIRRWRSIRRSYVTPEGTAVGIVRSVRVRITTQAIEPATVTLQLEPA